jgi:hypothetical protein
LFALQAVENLTQHQAGFTADRAESDDKVVWDEVRRLRTLVLWPPSRAQAPLKVMKETMSP